MNSASFMGNAMERMKKDISGAKQTKSILEMMRIVLRRLETKRFDEDSKLPETPAPVEENNCDKPPRSKI